MQDLIKYYSQRALEYEQVYERDDPARQEEQLTLAEALKKTLAGRSVLEIACGTGYWTQAAAQVAHHVVATDVSFDMLSVASEKGILPGRVTFRQADAYKLEQIPGTFDAGVANFFLSHVPKACLDDFLDGLHARLGTGSIVFMADNVYVPGIGGELFNRLESADTFKLRTLSDGSKHHVLKNYYDADQLQRIFHRVTNLHIHVGACFWWITYEVA